MPFNVEFTNVADRDLGPLLTQGAALGYTSPSVVPVEPSLAGPTTPPREGGDELAADWKLIATYDNQTYQWPETVDDYSRYAVYMGRTRREGPVHVALGWTQRPESWGRSRSYAVAFLTQRAPQTPLVEFLETDDHEETGDMLAIIRGSDGARKMYAPTVDLPSVYTQHFRTEIYRDRVHAPRAWNKMAVVVHKGDTNALLNHALVQARRRGDI